MSSTGFYSASVYAKAVLSLKLDLKEMQAVVCEVLTIAEHDISNLSYKILSKIPLSQITQNFIKVLFEQNKIHLLPQIAKILKYDFLKSNNASLVAVNSAEELSTEVETQIKSELQNYFKKDIILEKSIDKNLINGFTLLFDTYFIDFSKKAQIHKIKSCVLK